MANDVSLRTHSCGEHLAPFPCPPTANSLPWPSPGICCYIQMLCELGKLQQLVGAPYSSCASQEC